MEEIETKTSEDLLEGNRCNVSFSDRWDGFNVSLSISKNIPEKIPYQSYIKELSEDFYKFFKERRQRFMTEQAVIKKLDPEPSWAKKKQGGGQKSQQPQQNSANLGVCKDCGAPKKMSKNNKPYCSAKCWLQGGF